MAFVLTVAEAYYRGYCHEKALAFWKILWPGARIAKGS